MNKHIDNETLNYNEQLLNIEIEENYDPELDNGEYMNEKQQKYFLNLLIQQKKELIEESNKTIEHLKGNILLDSDPTDRATTESNTSLELRTRDRYWKLLMKIDKAIDRINKQEYGWCEETGLEIGIKRLKARPMASLCIFAQELSEQKDKMYYENDEDRF